MRLSGRLLHRLEPPAMDWEQAKSAFVRDGSLRDLYVLDTTVEDWRSLFDFVRGSTYGLRFRHGDDWRPVPADPDGFFAGQSEWTTLLSIDVSGFAVNAHFFETDQIELDIEPSEVQTPERAEALFEFMRDLARALGKPVRLTPENCRDYVLIEYDPASDELRKEHDHWTDQ